MSTVYLWRWVTVADPNAPHDTQARLADGRRIPRIPHPLASRLGQPCRVLAQSPKNGSRLIRFESDGALTVAPYYSVMPAKPAPVPTPCHIEK